MDIKNRPAREPRPTLLALYLLSSGHGGRKRGFSPILFLSFLNIYSISSIKFCYSKQFSGHCLSQFSGALKRNWP